MWWNAIFCDLHSARTYKFLGARIKLRAGKEVFFFEKKKQKTFDLPAAPPCPEHESATA
jgi:hypothetical protein